MLADKKPCLLALQFYNTTTAVNVWLYYHFYFEINFDVL